MVGFLFRDNFGQEVVSDVVSGADVELVCMDVNTKLGDSSSNGSRGIRAAHFVTDD